MFRISSTEIETETGRKIQNAKTVINDEASEIDCCSKRKERLHTTKERKKKTLFDRSAVKPQSGE